MGKEPEMHCIVYRRCTELYTGDVMYCLLKMYCTVNLRCVELYLYVRSCILLYSIVYREINVLYCSQKYNVLHCTVYQRCIVLYTGIYWHIILYIIPGA